MDPVLILTDLDRTLIPNGHQPESPEARPVFRHLADDKDILIAYVTGRDLNLLQSAIEEYNLPIPDYAIGDVGTSLFENSKNKWTLSEEWHSTISKDWHNVKADEIADRLKHIATLTLQEAEKQGPFKLSYYTETDVDFKKLKLDAAEALAGCPAEVSMVHSIDEITCRGLFDILPKRANKLQAVRFLMDTLDVQHKRTVFSGDSGNDMDVLTSDIQSTLVGNASAEVRETALGNAHWSTLYLAEGKLYNMNGNYAAGILEGLIHFIPEIEEKILQCLSSAQTGSERRI